MKVKYVQLNAFFQERVADAAQLKRCISIALGMALGRTTPMPSSMPQLARSFYMENVQANIERAAAAFNENIIVDFDLVEQVARGVWLVRAGMCHPLPMVEVAEAGTPGDVLVQMSNESHTFSPEVYEFMNANRECLFVMMNRIMTTMTGEEEGREERRA